jgi:hypothetical protein
MVSLFAKNSVNRGFDPGRVKLRTNTLIVVASALSIHPQEKRTKTGWLGFRITCPSGVIYLHADWCVSELALNKNSPKGISLPSHGK